MRSLLLMFTIRRGDNQINTSRHAVFGHAHFRHLRGIILLLSHREHVGPARNLFFLRRQVRCVRRTEAVVAMPFGCTQQPMVHVWLDAPQTWNGLWATRGSLELGIERCGVHSTLVLAPQLFVVIGHTPCAASLCPLSQCCFRKGKSSTRVGSHQMAYRSISRCRSLSKRECLVIL